MSTESMNVNFGNLNKNFISSMQFPKTIIFPVSKRAEVPRKNASFCCERSLCYSNILLNLTVFIGDRCIKKIEDDISFSAFTKVGDIREDSNLPIPFLKSSAERIAYAPHLVYLENSNEIKNRPSTAYIRKKKPILNGPLKKLAPAPYFFYLSVCQIPYPQFFTLKFLTKDDQGEIELDLHPTPKNAKRQRPTYIKRQERLRSVKL